MLNDRLAFLPTAATQMSTIFKKKNKPKPNNNNKLKDYLNDYSEP